MYAVCFELAEQFMADRNANNFRLEVMKHLVIEPQLSEEMTTKANVDAIGEELYHQVKEFYTRKSNGLREQMTPTLAQILKDNNRIEQVVVPFTDGVRGMQVYVDLKESVEQSALPVVQALEKNITLGMIDDAWKNHLRAMDDLRTSVRMASYEQKDPLLIYKFEAFGLFKQMMLETNRDIISFLLRTGIPVQEAPPQVARRPEPTTDMSKMRANKSEIDSRGQDYAADEEDYYTETPDQNAPKRTPVQAGPKIGRNDPCPCGSGKIYKACHGKGVTS
jgi:preprotein translocase subunit SecA